MKYSALTGRIAVLAFCLLLVPVLASPENPVERPFKSHGRTVIMLDMSQLDPNTLEAPWFIDEENSVGMGTHMGRYTSSGSGTYNVVSGALVGTIIATVASGDSIRCSVANNEFTFTGGTGRFANVSGSFV